MRWRPAAATWAKVFVDNTFVEVFAMGGRLALTAPVAPATPSSSGDPDFAAGMSVFARAAGGAGAGAGSGGVEAGGVSAWHLGSAWVGLDEVLAARR